MNEHTPPIRPGQTYSQGYWYAVIAAVLYLIGAMILMVNMLGYFLGHYPQHFELDHDQRTLILQTMMFFFWLAGGALVFSKVCGFTYTNALYYCDVTVLTIGFGDIVPLNSAGRGLVLPYSVFGIIFLGLMINSIRKFAVGMSRDEVIRRHQLNQRARTIGRSVTTENELRQRLGLPPRRESNGQQPSNVQKQSMEMRRASLEQYGHFGVHGHTITFHENRAKRGGGHRGSGRSHGSGDTQIHQSKSHKRLLTKLGKRREKLILLKEEKDRFEAMRDIQANTSKFKKYYSLAMSVLAFGLLWCIGALVFFYTEHRIQGLTYFESLYFCYVSLLTIGYGDFSPKSNAGKPFFVVWSLVAIPTMTVLVSDMGDTVVTAVNRGTFTLADWTVMPKVGVWHDFLENHPRIKGWLERKTKEREAQKRIEQGFELQNPDEEAPTAQEEQGKDTLDILAEEPPEVTDHDLARRLATTIKIVANDLRADKPKKYSYEEWVGFTRLIRFSKESAEEVEEEEEEEGMVDWDWIGEDSPMLADVGESEWVLDRLCESLNRYTRKQAREVRSPSFRVTTAPVKTNNPTLIAEVNHANTKPHQARKSAHYHCYPDDTVPKRSTKYHDKFEHYPAHPGPRPFGKRPDSAGGSISPAFGRSSTTDGDDDDVTIPGRAVVFTEDRNIGSSGSGGSGGSGSGSSSGTVVGSEAQLMHRGFETREVRDWAARMDSSSRAPERNL